MSGWVVSASAALTIAGVNLAASGSLLAAEALTPAGPVAERLVDGSASVVLLTVAASAIYALLRGHIVPMAQFEARLQAIEHAISAAAESARHGAEALEHHSRETAEASKRIERAVLEVLSEMRDLTARGR